MEAARAALVVACATVGLDGTGAELIRMGDNAVFRLASRPVVVRVGRGLDRLADASREIAVARWLGTESVPVITPLDVEQPVVAQNQVVTLWESASERPEYGSARELAVLLHLLHRLPVPVGLGLRKLDPFRRVAPRIDRARALSDDDRRYLRSRGEELAEAYGDLAFVLPRGVIHGDASVGNVIRDQAGEPVFVDLDGFAVGPREWDLVLTALYYDRFGWHTEAEYTQFVEVYGFDVMAWPGYAVLADVREFLMVTWLSQNATDPTVGAELRRRIADLRGGGSRKGWQPF